MNIETINLALRSLSPAGHWNVRGDTLEGIEWLDKMPERPSDKEIKDEIARLASLPKSATISYSDLRLRLTDAEREAILIAARTDWIIDDLLRGEINLVSGTNTQTKAAFVGAGLLTRARADVVLAP